MMVKELFDKKLLKFLLVGVINTLIGTGTMFLLYNLLNCSYWFSSASNYIVGGICSYFLNKYFTFNNKKKSLLQIIYFIINLLLCYFFSYFGAKIFVYKVLYSMTDKLKDNIAMIIGEIGYTVLNYLGQRLIVFNNGEQND